MRSRLPFREGIRIILILPIMIPGLLIGVSLLVLFVSTLHWTLSTRTAVIGQAVYTTPFVILLVAARLQGFDAALERAAADLGANAFQRLRRVVLPLIFPAILAGALFAFTLSLDEFIITYFLIGANNTLPIYIYTQVKFGITPEVNAVATMLLAGSLHSARTRVRAAAAVQARAARRRAAQDRLMRIATAPVSWGIWEMTIDRPDLIPPQTYLDTIVDMGYTATETGPPGYFAPSAAAAAERAGRAGVELIATFLPLRLDDPSGFEEDLAALDRTVAVLEATGGGVVLLADMETPDRARAAGSEERRRETGWEGDDSRPRGRAPAARDGHRARSRAGRGTPSARGDAHRVGERDRPDSRAYRHRALCRHRPHRRRRR